MHKAKVAIQNAKNEACYEAVTDFGLFWGLKEIEECREKLLHFKPHWLITKSLMTFENLWIELFEGNY